LEPVPDLESVRAFFRICQRRKSFIFGTAASVILVSVGLCGFVTPAYTASSVIQIEHAEAAQGAPGASDLQAQANVLQSDALVLKAISDLKLEQDHDSPGGRRSLVNALRANLKVKVVPGTQQLEVDYTDPDPKLAAAIVNHLVDVFADETVPTTIKATNQPSQWLEGQLSELRKQSETLQSKAVALEMTNEFVDPDLRRKPVIYTSTLARLQRSTVLLSQARMNFLLKASVAEVVKTGNPVLIAQLSGTSAGSAGSDSVRSSLARMQNLLRRQATLQLQIDRDSSHMKSLSPNLIRDRESLKILQQSLSKETERSAKHAQQDLTAASLLEQDLRAENQVDRAVALQLKDRSIEYATLPTEAEQSWQLYHGLLKRLKNAGMLEVIHSSNLTVVTKATASSSQGDSRAPVYLALGGGFGMFLGCCVALFVDAVETRKRQDEEGWSVRINGSSIPRIRGMNSAAFSASKGRNGLTLTQRKEPAPGPLGAPGGRTVTDPRQSQIRQMGRLIVLRPAAGKSAGS
jgi:polysaccharide biosynthesis transport protein